MSWAISTAAERRCSSAPQGAPAFRDVDFAWLGALPVAAGVVAGEGDAARVIASNAAFDEIYLKALAARPNGNLIVLLMKTHVAGHGDRTAFLWSPPQSPGRQYMVNVAPFASGADAGDEPLVLVTLLDRAAMEADEGSFRQDMLRDILTGLPNRRAFTDAVDATITGSGEVGTFAVLALNLARFGRVNEAIGSLAGDELISRVARRLIACVPKGGMLARLIGDEFGLLIPLAEGVDDALHAARRLQEVLATPFAFGRLELRIDCAIGCAIWHERVATSHDIVRNAQFALKRAKRTGEIEIYEAGEAGRAQRRFGLETELRRAIEGDRLSLAFQPLVELGEGRVRGFEALARWHHPELGAIPPSEFITVAEEAGLIVPLGRWVLDRAAATLKAWDTQAGRELPIYVGVNVSPVQLARDRVGSEVEAALRRHGVGGRRLTLELTESSIVADPERAAGVLNALKALSCRIAMDDFGTGYSSLASLQRLPIDLLKIDRQFVRGLLRDRDSLAIVRAVLSLARALNMLTVAEGVEDAATALSLAELGTDIGQGYHFGRPMTDAAAFAYLTDAMPVAA